MGTMKQRKKELKEQFKQMKPAMGILMITCQANNKRLLMAASDLKSMANRVRFQLNMNLFPNKDLQQDWNTYGADAFTVEVLDMLEYAKDESKTDYKDDLEELRLIWTAKVRQEKAALY